MAGSTPSIKGTIIATAVEDVRRLLAAGSLSREDLEARVSRGAAALVDEKVLDGAWYPIAWHCELLRVLQGVEGGGEREYLVEGGRRAARALEASGLYVQMRQAARETDPDRIGRILVSMAGSIYNFTEWRFVGVGDLATSRIEVSDTAAFPDEVRWRAEGFIEHAVARFSGRAVAVASERPCPDTLIFRVDPH